MFPIFPNKCETPKLTLFWEKALSYIYKQNVRFDNNAYCRLNVDDLVILVILTVNCRNSSYVPTKFPKMCL